MNNRRMPNFIVSATLMALLSACTANDTHFTKIRQIPDKDAGASVAFIDAKQRAILTTRDAKVVKFCAEPSPDALSALAASQGFSFSKPGAAEIAATLSVAEGASSIGLRTQSIQLMRDVMYRYCEAYMSDMLGKPAFESLHRRLQSSMVAILAIEQLTGAMRPPAVTLSGTVVSESAELIAKYTEESEKAKAAKEKAEGESKKATGIYEEAKGGVASAKARLEGAQAALKTGLEKTPPVDGDAKKKLEDAVKKEEVSLEAKQASLVASETKKAQSEASLKVRQEAFEALEKTRKTLNASAGSPGFQVALESLQATNFSHMQHVAEEVGEIVAQTLELNYTRELCATVFHNEGWNEKPEPDTVKQACLDYLKQSAIGLKLRHEAASKFLSGKSELTIDELKNIESILGELGDVLVAQPLAVQ